MEAQLPRSPASLRRSQTNKARGIRPGRSRHAAYLNADMFDDFIAAAMGRTAPSWKDIAEFLDTGTSTVFNAYRGDSINGAFIAALAKKLGDTGYSLDDLVYGGEPKAKAAA